MFLTHEIPISAVVLAKLLLPRPIQPSLIRGCQRLGSFLGFPGAGTNPSPRLTGRRQSAPRKSSTPKKNPTNDPTNSKGLKCSYTSVRCTRHTIKRSDPKIGEEQSQQTRLLSQPGNKYSQPKRRGGGRQPSAYNWKWT